MLTLLNIWGWIVAHWRKVALAAGVLFILVFCIVLYKSCKPSAKIDEETIQKINKANESERKAELEKVIRENADVIQTADNRTLATEENIKVRQMEINRKIEEADKKIQEAKEQGRDVTQEELVCLLQPETCP